MFWHPLAELTRLLTTHTEREQQSGEEILQLAFETDVVCRRHMGRSVLNNRSITHSDSEVGFHKVEQTTRQTRWTP